MKRLLFSFALILGFAGCSSDSIDSADDGAGGTGEPAGETCEGPGYGAPTESQQVDGVSALLVDQDGVPLEGEDVQVCGLDICIYGTSSPNGGVVINPHEAMKKPAFKFGEGIVSARFAWLLPNEPTIDLGTVNTIRLPELGQGEAIVAGERASSGGLALEVPDESKVHFDGITFRTPEEQELRAVEVPLEDAPAVVEPALGFGIVYAATPTETTFCPGARVHVPNTPGWDAGAEVELWLHGVDVTEEWAPYGGWAKVSDARVSEDGSTIDTTEPGLPELGIIAFKLK